MGRAPGRLILFVVGLLFFGVFASARASAQSASPSASPGTTKDCSDFQTQQQAQAFYDQHKNDTPGDPDPFDLDADGDGTACEGLPSAAGTTATPTPTPASGPLSKTGAETGVLALSGFTLLEAGYGMTLLARKHGLKRRQVPAKVLRMIVHAGREGKNEVALTDDVYLVRRPAAQTVNKSSPTEREPSEPTPPVTAGRVYAAIANHERDRRDEPAPPTS